MRLAGWLAGWLVSGLYDRRADMLLEKQKGCRGFTQADERALELKAAITAVESKPGESHLRYLL